jgi:hypothetical protein
MSNRRTAEPRDLRIEVEYPIERSDATRWATWTLRTDRPLKRVLASVQAMHPYAKTIEVSVVKHYPAAHISHPWPGTVLTPYRLPSGEVVQIDEEVARGKQQIDFTLRGGEIVMAERL